jgi:hypothetical protein
MHLFKTISIIKILFCFLLIPVLASPQVDSKTLEKAVQLFDQGNYAEAEPLFKDLLKENPENITINYFYGACRTENNHFTNSDLESLIIANQDEAPVKISYYFGIQYHARNNWDRALKFYYKYNSTATLAEEEKQDLMEKIQQCYDKVNPFKEFFLTEKQENIIPANGAFDITGPDILDESELDPNNTVVTNKPVPIPENESQAIEFVVNSEITYTYISQFKTEDGKLLFRQGNAKQKELETALLRAEELRERYKDAKTNDEKKLLGQDILAMENETYSLKREAAQFLVQAKGLEYEYWQDADLKEINEFKQQLAQIQEMEASEDISETGDETDSAAYINPDILLENGQFVDPVEEKKENDLIYKIQIGAYSRGLPTYVKRLYDKLSLIRKIENYTDENGVVVYTTGNLSNLEDAITMQNQVRQEGVEDAFVVPYFKGKRISLKDAKELEEKQ